MADAIPTRSRELVVARDLNRCCRCGMPGQQWHHRRRRREKDEHTNAPCNGLRLCVKCHEWITQHPLEARGQGWIVRMGDNPEEVPVQTIQHGLVYLDHDGGFRPAENGADVGTIKPCKRPKVTVDPMGADRFLAVCHTPGCDWKYPPATSTGVALKVDADDNARRHRAEHRALVPEASVTRPELDKPYLMKCSCGYARCDGSTTTRTDAEAVLTSHLSQDHGLVVC